jgi:hypothetical protein
LYRCRERCRFEEVNHGQDVMPREMSFFGLQQFGHDGALIV